MVFMAILIPVVMQGLSLANLASVFAERKRMAAFLAHGKLNEIVSTESWSFPLTVGISVLSMPCINGNYCSQAGNRITCRELTCVVTFQVQGKEHQIQLSTLVEDAP